ncbi:MAG: phosphoenolpyruvate carboxykinase (GTP) [Chloroflexia bacterium]|nr:phosphoenolpyruvate carboxykinase (GTP) [Chloroflexia bacterium]
MEPETKEFLKSRLRPEDYEKLARIPHPRLHRVVARSIQICNPKRIFVSDDSPEDIAYIRQAALRDGEERALAVPGHTIHFDNYKDQARDRKHTYFLLREGEDLGPALRSRDRQEGLDDIAEIMADIMQEHELYICFFCLGPTHSEFSIPCVQMTDSSYVAHSDTLLYRPGYEEFVRQGLQGRFFSFLHSQGQLDERRTSCNLEQRRVYIDLEDDIVYSMNTQYGGNTIGLKKLAMRLAINRASQEGWLTEHMLVMGVNGPAGRVTYFTGAFPSLCGKTSTAMMEGENIVGDDIAYLRHRGDEVYAVNVEKGVFGIIQGINSEDDPLFWQALHRPGEIIFSNVLITPEGGVHWIGKDGQTPSRGENHSGPWRPGKLDEETGREIPVSHPNARFTMDLKLLPNLSPERDNPAGVKLGAVVYGGRDSDTWVPVEQSFDWVHGIIAKGASLESETTAATLGKEGVREFNPMSNRDFLSVPIGRYIQSNVDFGRELEQPPLIFAVNYFLRHRETKKWLNDKTDKRVWYKWMELRVHGEVEAIRTPTGWIPLYEDLRRLFRQVLDKEYTHQNYVDQFTVRVPEKLAKIERIEQIYRHDVPDVPAILFGVLEQERQRLLEAQAALGDYIEPERLLP